MDSKVKQTGALGKIKKEKVRDGFDESLIQVRRVTKVVKGGKQLHFRAIVVVGDKKGQVCVGKAKEVVAAISPDGYKMIGSFLTRGLVMVLGYAYPAYECYKTVEKNKPDVEQLRFWCQYWILVAMLTVMERVGDTFVSWVPMYSEAKLFFFIYLWYPKTRGTTYVYDSFFRPYIAKHETDIDRNLLELRTRAGDYAVIYWQRAASYGQTRVFDILQYIASQSTPRPRPTQPQQATRVRQPPAVQNRQATATPQTQTDEPASPTASTSSGEVQEDMVEDKNLSEVPAPAPPVAAANAQKSTVTQSVGGTSKPTASNEVAALAITSTSSSVKEDANPPGQDAVLEESTRVTRARLRRTRVTSIR